MLNVSCRDEFCRKAVSETLADTQRWQETETEHKQVIWRRQLFDNVLQVANHPRWDESSKVRMLQAIRRIAGYQIVGNMAENWEVLSPTDPIFDPCQRRVYPVDQYFEGDIGFDHESSIPTLNYQQLKDLVTLLKPRRGEHGHGLMFWLRVYPQFNAIICRNARCMNSYTVGELKSVPDATWKRTRTIANLPRHRQEKLRGDETLAILIKRQNEQLELSRLKVVLLGKAERWPLRSDRSLERQTPPSAAKTLPGPAPPIKLPPQ